MNLGEGRRREVAPLSSSAPSASGRSTSESLVFTFTVALDAFVEESFGRIADYAAESLEDDLQEDAAVRLVVAVGVEAGLVVVDPVAIDQAQLPAATVVLEATEGFRVRLRL